MMFSRNQESCIHCGGEKPVAVEKSINSGIIRFNCERCGCMIADGVVVENGEPRHGPYPNGPLPHSLADVTWPNSVEPSRAEAWWESLTFVVAINGKVVAGSKRLYEVVEHCIENDT